jgi:hypothetical protein
MLNRFMKQRSALRGLAQDREASVRTQNVDDIRMEDNEWLSYPGCSRIMQPENVKG